MPTIDPPLPGFSWPEPYPAPRQYVVPINPTVQWGGGAEIAGASSTGYVIDDPVPLDDLLGAKPEQEAMTDARARLLAKRGCRRCLGRGKLTVAPVGQVERREVCPCVLKNLEKIGS